MVLAAFLVVKHFLADGPMQTAYQVRNKGVLGHPGGLIHAGVHAGMSGLCLALWAGLYPAAGAAVAAHASLVTALLLAEFVLHYMIDFMKMRVDQKFRWSSVDRDGFLTVRSPAFFFSFLLDQACHHMTYVVMLAVIGRFILN